jgi:DNA-directed RNA polymerase subunit RPC12/RpoP
MCAYADDADCGRCGKPVHLPHDPPCAHGLVACPECGHAAVCKACAHIAEMEERMAAEPWTPHDLDNPLTMAEVIARTQARLEANALSMAQRRRTFWDAQRRYARWAAERDD